MSGRAIVITSGKGGVGKTTATANLGIGLAKHDRKIVMVDGDIGLRNLDIIMGLENRIIYHLVDVVCGRCQVRQALVKDKRFPSLFLLPASQVDQKEAISPEQMRDLATQLKEEFDFVLIDCPAGIEQGFRNAVAGADEAIVITTPDVSPVRDADRVIGLLHATEDGADAGRLIEVVAERRRQRRLRADRGVDRLHGDISLSGDVADARGSIPLRGEKPRSGSEDLVFAGFAGLYAHVPPPSNGPN